ncbi:MAG: hypothetical protein PUF12_01545 [Thermoflexaceae bacterium]|nr:hypothetical protein [Thermoflexaceae bacterium]
MKRIKKIIYLFIISLMAGSISFTAYAAEDDKDGEDIDIRIQALKDRQFDSQALTDGYDIEILTPSSTYYESEVSKHRQEEMEKLAASLSMDGFRQTDKNAIISSEVAEYGIFSNSYIAKNKAGLQEDKGMKSTTLIFGTVFCAIIGFFMARLWHGIRKKKE